MTTDDTAARWARQMADSFIETMTVETDAAWDFTPDTLTALDDLIDAWWPQGPSQDTIRNTGRAMAGYVGEVVRRNLGGQWIYDDRFGPSVRIDSQIAFPIA